MSSYYWHIHHFKHEALGSSRLFAKKRRGGCNLGGLSRSKARKDRTTAQLTYDAECKRLVLQGPRGLARPRPCVMPADVTDRVGQFRLRAFLYFRTSVVEQCGGRRRISVLPATVHL